MKKSLITAAIAALVPLTLTAEDGKVGHIGAHVHGVADLNISLDDEELKLELFTPSMNVLGFEYEPKTKAEKETFEHAEHELEHANEVFVIKGGACHVHNAHAHMPFEDDDHHGHKHEHKKDDHKHDHHGHKHDHKKDDHKHDHHGHKHDHKKDGHKHNHHGHKHDHKKDDHKHNHHDHEHSDIFAHYEFDCEKVKTLESVKVNLFDMFSGFEKINVQWIVGDKQGSAVLTKEKNVVSFK